MKITISQLVRFENDNFPYRWFKEYENSYIPQKGQSIESELWKNPYNYDVVECIVNYEQNECYVEVAPYTDIIPQSLKTEMKKMASLHGWQASW